MWAALAPEPGDADQGPSEPALPLPGGWCHFPQYGEDYFKQLTAEHLVLVKDRKGFSHYEWQLLPGRENHYLDCRVMARAAAYVAGLDRLTQKAPRSKPAAVPPPTAAPPSADTPPSQAGPLPTRPSRHRGSWLGGARPGGSWLGRRK
jgi:phage terminase large subunit GpA-like protein